MKLVASLRQKVKTKVKASLDGTATDKSKETNRKNLIQKVGRFSSLFELTCNCNISQAVFDELVHLVDPGVEPYKPKKGQTNVIMAVGLQVRNEFILRTPSLIPHTGKWKDDDMYKTGCALSETWIQISHSLCRYIPCRSV